VCKPISCARLAWELPGFADMSANAVNIPWVRFSSRVSRRNSRVWMSCTRRMRKPTQSASGPSEILAARPAASSADGVDFLLAVRRLPARFLVNGPHLPGVPAHGAAGTGSGTRGFRPPQQRLLRASADARNRRFLPISSGSPSVSPLLLWLVQSRGTDLKGAVAVPVADTPGRYPWPMPLGRDVTQRAAHPRDSCTGATRAGRIESAPILPLQVQPTGSRASILHEPCRFRGRRSRRPEESWERRRR